MNAGRERSRWLRRRVPETVCRCKPQGPCWIFNEPSGIEKRPSRPTCCLPCRRAHSALAAAQLTRGHAWHQP